MKTTEATCKFCGECAETDPRDKHNPYCPNQYPIDECRELAITDWESGFACTDRPEIMINPIFELGYHMGHPDS